MNSKKKSSTFLDIALLILVLGVTILIIRTKIYNLVSNKILGENLLYLSGAVPLILLIFQFQALRKITVFLSWMGISVVLLGLFFWLYNDASLNYLDKAGNTFNYSHGLAGPFFILLFYQICRQLSLRYYKIELGIPSRTSDTILEGDRKSTWIDIMCLIGFFAIPLAFYVF